MSEELRFRSKIDLWLIAVIFPVVLLGPIVVLVSVRGVSWTTIAAISLAPVLMVVGLMAWMVGSTSYLITDTTLVVRCGPVVRSMPLAAIRRIVPTRSVLSAPALSLDRLAIECDGVAPVVISPRDKSGFIRAIRERVPGVVVESDATQ